MRLQIRLLPYSIVNTLCELPNVNRVQITVEGESQEKYGEMDGFHLVLERNSTVEDGTVGITSFFLFV